MYIHNYYSMVKKKEILSFVVTHIILQEMMLTEISQAQKDNILYDLIRVPSKKSSLRSRE